MEQKDKKEKYDLYTEHIVPNTSSSTKKIIKKAIYTVLFGALFGVIAGGVMLLVFAGGHNEPESSEKPPVTLGNQKNDENDEIASGEDVTVSVSDDNEPTTEAIPEWDEELLSQLQIIDENYAVIKAIGARVQGYSVKVYKPSDGTQATGFYNVNEAFGLVVAEDEEHYYILTDKSFVSGNGDCHVMYRCGVSKPAEFIAADTTTGFSIVRTVKEGLTDVNIAVLGNSDAVGVGDIVVAVGELYGFVDSMGYGMITGANVKVSDTDSEFKIITTDIIGSANSFGVISNINGAVTGIITTNYNTGTSNHVAAYSIDAVAGIIEKLMNGQKCSYLGIRGLAVSEGIFSDKNKPQGIYISSIEINSPAYYAGVQPGDVITSIENSSITTMEEFMDALYNKSEGATTEIKVKRKGREQYKEIVFTLTLGVE